MAKFKSAAFLFSGVSPDGLRFLILQRAEPEPAPGVRVVLNWSEELKANATPH